MVKYCTCTCIMLYVQEAILVRKLSLYHINHFYQVIFSFTIHISTVFMYCYNSDFNFDANNLPTNLKTVLEIPVVGLCIKWQVSVNYPHCFRWLPVSCSVFNHDLCAHKHQLYLLYILHFKTFYSNILVGYLIILTFIYYFSVTCTK